MADRTADTIASNGTTYRANLDTIMEDQGFDTEDLVDTVAATVGGDKERARAVLVKHGFISPRP